MATIYWIGNSPAVAQVEDRQFGGTWEATDVINLTIGSKTLSIVAGSTVIQTIVDLVVTTWNALDENAWPEFREVTASRTSTDTLRLTARTAGKPFTVTAATTETGGGAADDQTIGTVSVVTASSGPNHADDAGNYSGGSLPTDSDILVFSNSSVDCLYELDALSAVTLAQLIVDQSYTGKIGLPKRNRDIGTNGYNEYRGRFLQVGASLVTIGTGSGNGSQRIQLDLGSVQSAIDILNSGQPTESGVAAVTIKGTHASNVLNVTKGRVDIAPDPGTASTIDVARISYDQNQQADAIVRFGPSVTLDEIEQNGGTVTIQSDTTSIIIRGGTCIALAGQHDSVSITGGVFDWRTTDEITALSASNARIELAKDPRPKDFASAATMQLYRGAVVNDPFGRLPVGADLKDNTGGIEIIRPAGTTYELN